MAYFGRTPKKPQQRGLSTPGRTLGGFGEAVQGPSARQVRVVLLRAAAGARAARPERPRQSVRAVRAARAGRSSR